MPEQTTLLYIDDDKAILKMVGGFFAELGYEVFLAKDGEEGLEAFHAYRPEIVLVDLRMPKVDGFQVLETITNESPDTPIIVISGEGEMSDVIQALRSGAWNYLTKPIDNLVLIEHSVEQALEKAKLIKINKAHQKGLEVKLGAVVENFPGFVFIYDNNNCITYMNPALVNYVGRDATGDYFYKTVFGTDSKSDWFIKNFTLGIDLSKFEIQSPKDARWYHAIHSSILDKDGNISERQVILYDITERKQAELDFEEREEYLRKENVRLRASLSDRYKFGNIIGKSGPMQEVYETIINAAASDASVIIYGESGTGKELVAQAIHENSDRKDRRLIYVNCGAVPENLIESEFFGYKKGAFTGAAIDKHGYLDLAAGGILFLDEVGEIPLSMQIKLLRAVEGNGYTPVGGTEVRKPDVRIIAATNRDLKEQVRQGLMRQDFLYRIHIIPVNIPPLRDRKEDIPLLIEHFLAAYDQETIPTITPQIAKALQDYQWPGNVRELQNTLKRFVSLKKLDFMGLDLNGQSGADLAEGIDIELRDKPLTVVLEELERLVLIKALEKFNWHQGETSKALQIGPKTLYRKMKQFCIDKPSTK
jgi:DNA-binding NtrC family response regulator